MAEHKTFHVLEALEGKRCSDRTFRRREALRIIGAIWSSDIVDREIVDICDGGVGFWGSGVAGRSDGVVRWVSEQRHDEDTPKGGQPRQEPSEIVAGGGEDGVGGVAV